MNRRGLIALCLVAIVAIGSGHLSAAGDDPAHLIYLMEKGGAVRRQAFWYAFQSKQFFLMRRVIRYLDESEDPEDHRTILRVLELMGPQLDTYIPGWYDRLDEFMRVSVPDDILIRCMKLAVRFKEHRLVFAVNRMMEHPAYAVRLEAIQSLVAMENDNVVPVLIRFMKSSDPVTVIYGLQGAMVLGDSRFQPFVQELLDSPNKSIRIFAMKALADLKVEGDTSFLITGRFSKESNAEARRIILKLIGSRMMSGQQYLVIRGMQDSSPLVREAAYETALLLKNSLLAQEISRALLRETDPSLRKGAIRSLASLGMGDASNSLSRILLADPDQDTRSLAARAIRILRDRSQSSALLQAAREDRSPSVRNEAAVALIGLAEPSQGTILVDAILNELRDSEERLLLFQALQKTGNQEALKDLKSRAGSIRDPLLRRRIQEDV